MPKNGASNFIIVHKYLAKILEVVFDFIISHNWDVLN